MSRSALSPAAAFVLSALLAAVAAAPARAFVRSVTDTGTPVFWQGNCAFIVPDSAVIPDLTPDAVIGTFNRVLANWQGPTVDAGCGYLRIHLAAPATVDAHLDYQNVIKFRTDKWCRPAEKGRPEMCYAAQAAAITTVFYQTAPGHSNDGQIVDADIELNAINYTFANLPTSASPRPGTQIADLENTLTHEIGHFQGLDHTCWDSDSIPKDPLDDAGNPVPS